MTHGAEHAPKTNDFIFSSGDSPKVSSGWKNRLEELKAAIFHNNCDSHVDAKWYVYRHGRSMCVAVDFDEPLNVSLTILVTGQLSLPTPDVVSGGGDITCEVIDPVDAILLAQFLSTP